MESRRPGKGNAVRPCLTILIVCALVTVVGCTTGGGGGNGNANGNDNEPAPETVLAGDWSTAGEAGGTLVVTFSSGGVVTQLQGTSVDGVIVTLNITGATSEVDGSDVTFIIPLADGDVTFEGTLSADESTLTGELSRNIQIGDNVTITVPAGAVTLTRGTEPAPECEEDADCEDGETCEDGDCVTTGEFAGSAACQTCHAAQHADWSETLHADALATLEASDHAEDFCIGCHVVGYEEGGFVSRAETPELADVGCESCHGPAAAHVANPGDAAARPSVSIGADVCGRCHTGTHHPTYEQWQESGHAGIDENVTEDLLAGGFYVLSCGICHSGDVFYESAILGEDVPEDRFAGAAEEDLNPITCVVCHDPHAQTGNAVNPTDGRDYQLRYAQVASPTADNTTDGVQDKTRFNLCGQCHHSRGRDWTATERGPHHSVQSNVYVGEMPAPEGEEPLVANTASVHAGVPEQCSTCHLYRKDFESEEAPTISGHLFTVNYEGCLPCHTAEVAEQLFDGIEAEVQARLDAIAAALGDPADWEYSATGGPPEEADAEPGESSQADISDEVKQARFLYSYIVSDGSQGTHNPAYVRAMLTRAEELLGITE